MNNPDDIIHAINGAQVTISIQLVIIAALLGAILGKIK
jgi:hypothetical protein